MEEWRSGGAEERRSGRVDPLIIWRGVVALAWLLARSPVILPIPGTSKVAHGRTGHCRHVRPGQNGANLLLLGELRDPVVTDRRRLLPFRARP